MVYSTSTAVKCRSKNPSACVDPRCPEQVHAQRSMDRAAAGRDFGAYTQARDQVESRNRSTIQSQFRPVPRAPQVNVTGQANYKVNTGSAKPERKGITGLFHSELGFPSTFRPPTGVRPLQYSHHAKQAATDDRYGNIELPSNLNLDEMKLIEVGVENGSVSKFLYRGKMDDTRDICIVVIPKPRGEKWFVKTVWINENNDKHRSLDVTKYLVPKKRVEAPVAA